MVFKTDYHLIMQVKSIAECSKWSIPQYFRPSLSYQLSLRPLFCLFLRLYCISISDFTIIYWYNYIINSVSSSLWMKKCGSWHLGYKAFSCSTDMSIRELLLYGSRMSYIPRPCNMSKKFVLVINFKMPSLVGILKFAIRPTDTVCCFEKKIDSFRFILFVLMLHFPVKKCSVICPDNISLYLMYLEMFQFQPNILQKTSMEVHLNTIETNYRQTL